MKPSVVAVAAAVIARQASSEGYENDMHDCCVGVPLRIGYFAEDLPPYQYYDPGTHVRSGGLVDLSELITDTMGYDVAWVDMGVTGGDSPVSQGARAFAMIGAGQIDLTLSSPSFGYGPEAIPGAAESQFLTPVPLVDLGPRLRDADKFMSSPFTVVWHSKIDHDFPRRAVVLASAGCIAACWPFAGIACVWIGLWGCVNLEIRPCVAWTVGCLLYTSPSPRDRG